MLIWEHNRLISQYISIIDWDFGHDLGSSLPQHLPLLVGCAQEVFLVVQRLHWVHLLTELINFLLNDLVISYGHIMSRCLELLCFHILLKVILYRFRVPLILLLILLVFWAKYWVVVPERWLYTTPLYWFFIKTTTVIGWLLLVNLETLGLHGHLPT